MAIALTIAEADRAEPGENHDQEGERDGDIHNRNVGNGRPGL
jgi:hypothetical protein